ncbi:MAG TPA: alpha/beta hydrolase [Gaiellaceae bacterium]
MVCLVHGLGVSHRTFAPLWRLLARAQCPDLPGDDVPALVAALRRAAPPGALLVANSLGAQVAIELAAAEPQRVAGLVLIGPTGDPAQRWFVPQLARLLSCTVTEPAPLVPRVARDYVRWGPRRLLATARSMLDRPVDGLLSGLQAPTVVVRGDRDPICRRGWAERVASAAPRGRLVVVPGAGHAVHWSHPRAVAGLVEELEQELGASAASVPSSAGGADSAVRASAPSVRSRPGPVGAPTGAASTSRRTSSGRSAASRAQTRPPGEWPTRSTGAVSASLAASRSTVSPGRNERP